MAFADWSCDVARVAKTDDGALVVELRFRNAVTGRIVAETVRTRSAVASAEWVQDIARDRIVSFEGQEIALSVGPLTPSPIRQVPLARRQWETARQRLEVRKHYLDLGVIQNDDAILAQLRAAVAAGLADYWDL